VEVTLADGTTRQLRGANVMVSTGTRALKIIPGLAEAQPLTHIEALELDEIPGHLLLSAGATSEWRCPRRRDDSAAR
jgi:pyruvate/2-oxoglutarate dehydrogenase complex dihydrolipoamide dehydrogenase (E3) component